jgi:hypothetical protein
MKEQVEKVQAFLSFATVDAIILDSEVKSTFVSLHEEIFKTSAGCDGCPNEVLLSLRRLKQFVENNTNGKTMTAKKYQFKNNVQFYFSRLSVVLTNDNLSDDVAREVLKENNNMIKHFEVFPEDWKKDIEAGSSSRKKTTTVVESVEETAPEVKTAAKEVNKKSKK